MKIGILTQPLLNNYGGLLQAFALQVKLKDLGHDPWIINRTYDKPGLKIKLKRAIKDIFYRYIATNKNIPVSPNEFEYNLIYERIDYFKSEYIFPITHKIDSSKGLHKIKSDDFDAFVVGSDQVWREAYSPCIMNYFFDFAAEFKNIKRISYAASFGTSQWEIDKNKISQISNLASKFNAISVRETSGIDICQKYLGVAGIEVLDPTMLLDVDIYRKLIIIENDPVGEATLMTYLLDHSEIKNSYIEEISKKLNLDPFSILPKAKFTVASFDNLKDTVFPSVTKWLSGFKDAEFVVTDSFHGCVFSILFNKPFIAIGNKKRGLARFESLLRKFELEDRLVLDTGKIDIELVSQKIDWNKVNSILKKEKDKSIAFLQNNLK